MRIAADGIRFGHRPGHPLFQDFSVELRPGTLCALIGPSGSGKSTLLSLFAGFRRPDAGTITRDGISRISWVLQNPIGIPRRTALDQIVQPLLFQGIRRDEAVPRARELLERFHLADLADRDFRLLSGGEAQRLSFARAAASAPDALLLDEPTAQLDPATAASVRTVIRELVSAERIVVLATHDRELSAECDDIIDLADYRAAA